MVHSSLHHSRKGIHPDTLEKIILDWSGRISHTVFLAEDYAVTTQTAKPEDIIYLDPPYFHTKGYYFGSFDHERFFGFLEDLNRRQVRYLLSYDGKGSDRDYSVDLPKDLYKTHVLLLSGSSAFRKVIDKRAESVRESLYLNY